VREIVKEVSGYVCVSFPPSSHHWRFNLLGYEVAQNGVVIVMVISRRADANTYIK